MARITLANEDQLIELFEAHIQVVSLMRKHGLKPDEPDGWKPVFDRSKQRGGQCRYAKRELGFSGYLFAIWTPEQREAIILHEIAHALCPGHGHDKVWRAKLIAIGGNGKRCWGSDGEQQIKGRWVGTCPRGHKIYRQRKSKVLTQRRSCARCSPAFDERYLITWKEV